MSTMTEGRIRTLADGTRIARLRDGRDLAFLELGDPAARPVFYFHGTPSSRLEAQWAAEAATRHGFRLIPVDRPGLGRSSFQKHRTFLDWPKDVGELADLLGLARFGVAGHSGGGAFTFAAAHELADRLDFAIAFCPWGPPTLGSLADDLNFLDRLYFRIAKRFPGIMNAAFAPLGWMVRFAPKLFFRIMKGSVGPADKEVLDRPGMVEHFTKVLQEAFRSGGRGAAWEAMICYQPWGFELHDISCPVHVWAGDQDVFIPNEMADAMERELRQPVFHRLAGTGHLCIEHWDDAFAAVSDTGKAQRA